MTPTEIRKLARAQTMDTIQGALASVPEVHRAAVLTEWSRSFPEAALRLRVMRDPRAAAHLVDQSGNTYSLALGSRRPDLDLRMGWPEPTEPAPTHDRLEDWVNDSVCEATDGCTVEPDGICEHGHPSWLLKMGLI